MRPPNVLSWLADQRQRGRLSPETHVSLHAIGMSYGTQDSMIEATYDDALEMRANVLIRSHNHGGSRAGRRGRVGGCLDAGHSGRNLASASGREPAGARERAREFGFHDLDGRFRIWLSSLGASEPADAGALWTSICRESIAAEGARLVREAGPDAVLGRHVNGKHLDAALADVWFRASLASSFPPHHNGRTRRDSMHGNPHRWQGAGATHVEHYAQRTKSRTRNRPRGRRRASALQQAMESGSTGVRSSARADLARLRRLRPGDLGGDTESWALTMDVPAVGPCRPRGRSQSR